MKHAKLSGASFIPSSTFISGAEHAERIGHYINCSVNAYDLRPAANIILGAAYKMREAMPDDQPLVILMGEPHSMPSRIELQHLVASRLLADGQKFTFNFEYDHNYWSTLARHGMGKEILSDLQYCPTDYDPKGQALLSAFLGVGGFGGTPVSIDSLMAFCHDQEIPTIFNCPATDETFALDLKDPFTAAMVRRHLERDDITGLKLDRSNPEDMRKCMAITNLAMAYNGIAYANTQQANIILQHAGLNHVFGNEQEGCSYETSLSAVYSEAGAVVLPVFATIKEDALGLNILPKAAYQSLSQSVVIDGLAEDKFMMGEELAEKAFITEKLHGNSGGEPEFYDVAAKKEKYIALAHAQANALLKRYEMT